MEQTVAKLLSEYRRKEGRCCLLLLFLNSPKQNFFSVQIKDQA